MSTSSPLFEIDGLSVEFKTRSGTVSALKEVSLHLGAGEVLGVVGESGSGKSVTAYTAMGLLDQAGRVTSGRAVFDGVVLTNATESVLGDVRGREISMIFQSPRAALNPTRPVGKQIGDVLLRHSQASRQDVRQKAIDMLAKVRIADPAHRYWSFPHELSGGMCQRVMIAMALSCGPRLLIADEPTTGLDVTTQKAIMDLIQDLTGERRMSMILITHDLGLAASYCDRIAVMEKGRVVETGPVAELFSAPSHAYTKKLIAATPRLDSTLDDLGTIADEAGAAKPSPAMVAKAPSSGRALLEVHDLVKEFPRRQKQARFLTWRKTDPADDVFRAVDGVSFTLKKGESLGLVGESGCGKSTTSAIVTRLLDPTSGDVIFDGENITTFSARGFAHRPQRAKIQMVFQDPTDSLNPRHSARDLIAEPLKRLGGTKSRKEIVSKVAGLAEMVGLPENLLTRFPHQLSGGQKARVGIARAIALDPLMLVLDEPTSALDVSVQAVVLRLLDRLKRELGMSYIFVSHDLNVVRLLCERVLVMNKGRIVESGPAVQVLNAPRDAFTRNLVNAIPHLERPMPSPSAPSGGPQAGVAASAI